MILVLLPFFRIGMEPNPVEANSATGIFGFIQALKFALGIFVSYLAIIGFVYYLGMPYWLPPYTILVLILWIWSLKKSKLQIYKMFIWSPIFLAILVTLFSVFVSYFDLFHDMNYLGEDIFSGVLFCIFPTSIAFGYIFIGMIAWIDDFLRGRGIIVNEDIVLNIDDVRN